MPYESSNNAAADRSGFSTNQPTNEPTNQSINQSTNQLITYTLHLADTALIQGHRNSEWTGHGPILEQDIALSNIALDLIGQSRYLYQYAAQLLNENAGGDSLDKSTAVTEDSLAYLRDECDYKNLLLVELPNGDWGKTVLKQFFFSTYQFYLFSDLQHRSNHTLAAIAQKSLKEVTYHLKWSAEWVIRLGDGTEDSHNRVTRSLQELWKYTSELYTPADYEQLLRPENISADLSVLKDNWMSKVNAVLKEATIDRQIPSEDIQAKQPQGKHGVHTEYLRLILSEMQYLQRAYPNSEW